MVTRVAGVLLVTAAVLVVAGAGCGADTSAGGGGLSGGGGSASSSVASSSGPPDLPVVVFRNRADDLSGIFSVKVTNDGPDELRIHSVTLRTAAYTTPGPVDVETTVAAGLRVDLRVPVGEPVCGAGADAPTATVELSLGATGDPGQQVEVSREVPADELVSWNRRECAVVRTREVADPVLVGPWLPGTDATGRAIVDGTLRLSVDEAAAGEVVITAMERTVIFAPVETDFPVTVAPGREVDIAVRLATGRCDPHAVAEATAKYGFIFPVRVSVAGAEPVVVPTTVPPADRLPLFDLLDRTCGFSS